MSKVHVFSLRFIAFALTPLLVLLLATETTVRLKYFVAHGHDGAYLTTPFVRGGFTAFLKSAFGAGTNIPTFVKPVPDQMVFRWQKPCVDRMVYSAERRKEMPRTWDENCLRGDRVTPQKGPNEYRIIFVGGSTVEDMQSDSEMMTAQFKRVLPTTLSDKRIAVVNAGKVGFESRRILVYWKSTLRTFSPDLLMYYEAWNEQPSDVKWVRVDDRISTFGNRVHKALYYRSLLYTYLVEKVAYLTTSNDHFWKTDVNELRHFTELARLVRESGSRFVFVTQVVRFPRMWKSVDTFDYHAVDALLDRLRADKQYVYDPIEISALNQRLAVFYTIDLCRQHDIPVVNILDRVEALGEAGRADMFMDLGHLTIEGDRVVGELIARGLKLADVN
jgi:hypothetical protein